MQNRREFIVKSTAVGATVAVTPTLSAGNTVDSLASKRLRILILGGTGHIGPYFVQAALSRGHRVSILVRKGKESRWDHTALLDHKFPQTAVEYLYGDRNGDLTSIQGRDWDAVIDVATYGPLWVKTLGVALNGRVRHYTFISSDDVYVFPRDNGTGFIDETSKILEYTGNIDPYSSSLVVPSSDKNFQYGPLKGVCEKEAENQFPGRALIVRPGAIVGPHDAAGAFTYLPVRMQKGGDMVVVGDPLSHIQIVDIRDMAEWVIRLAERGEIGTFNCTGPAESLGWAETLGAVRGTTSQAVSLTWIPLQWVIDQKLFANNYNYFLFWPTEANSPGMMRTINAKAIGHGLRFRPLGLTATDTLTWYNSTPKENLKWTQPRVDESFSQEKELLAAWRAKGQLNQSERRKCE
jgi:2'-hydroxyisoflavone reductase